MLSTNKQTQPISDDEKNMTVGQHSNQEEFTSGRKDPVSQNMSKFSSGGEQTAFEIETVDQTAGGLMGSKDFNISMIKAQEDEPQLKTNEYNTAEE